MENKISEIKLEIVVNDERKVAIFIEPEKIDEIMVSNKLISEFVKDLMVAE